MDVLVDTHVVIWWVEDDPALSVRARELLGDPSSRLLVSDVCLWEIAIKRALGKLRADDDLPGILDEEGFTRLPIAREHVWAVADLPAHHRDPFDRLLVSQARREGLPVLSADPVFVRYGVPVVW